MKITTCFSGVFNLPFTAGLRCSRSRGTRAFFCLSLLLLCLSASAQKVDLNAEKQPLLSVLKSVSSQSGYLLWYGKASINKAKPVTLQFNKVELREALTRILSDQPFIYEIVDSTIVIKSRPAPSKAGKNISGRITNEKGEPLSGASVTILGTERGTATSPSGTFSLTEVSESEILGISYLGHRPEQREVGTEQFFEITLNTDASMLQEVNISTGFQTIPKERATGSFSTVDNQTFNRQVSTDVISRLKGIAPSLAFDERSGFNTFLSIRGRSTIFGNDQPLIVVDNFPFEGDLRNINPNDVQDITILKDAAAASIWGVRAGNGVIVITTKKGKLNQRLKVDLTVNTTFGGKPDLYYRPTVSPSEFIDIEMDLFSRGFYDPIISNTFSAPPLSPVVEILEKRRQNELTDAQASDAINAMRAFDYRNDAEKYLYQNILNQQYSLNISGGAEKSAYYLSTSLDQNRMSLTGNSFSRFAVNANQSYSPIKSLTISGGIAYNRNLAIVNNTQFSINMGDGRKIYPYARLADNEGNHMSLTRDFRNSFKQNALSAGYLDWTYVPLDELDRTEIDNALSSARLFSSVNYKIIPELSADIKLQYENQQYNNSLQYGADSYFMRDLINRYTVNSGGTLKRNIPLGASLQNTNGELASLNGRAQLNFQKTWSIHEITAIAGFEVREVKTNGSSDQRYGYDPLLGTSVGVDYANSINIYPSGFLVTIPRNEGISGTIDRFRSYYSNASYTLLGRYTLSGSARVDQSNLFGVDANLRAVPLWSTGLKWDISKENFFTGAVFDRLSLRASYGYNGNYDNRLTAYTTARTTRGSVTQLPAAALINPPNPKLQWEKNAVMNLGIDFSLLHERISGSFEYFTKRGRNLIGSTSIDPTTGFTRFRGNVANMDGKGMDIELNTQNLKGKSLRWTSNFIFSYATDKIIDYTVTPLLNDFMADNSLDRTVAVYAPVSGRPMFGIYSHSWAGLDPATGAARGYVNGQPSSDYSAIITEVNVDLPNRLVFNGPALAPYFGAVRNTFSWKQLDLSFNITYRFGYYFKRPSVVYSDIYTSYTAHADYNLRWKAPGDEQRTNVPAMIYPADGTADSFYLNSETLVEKGDHIRLQDISLSYSPKLAANKWLTNFKVFALVNNVGLLWTENRYGIDPDFPSQKPLRTIALGLNCSL